jgi:hypothetical protein
MDKKIADSPENRSAYLLETAKLAGVDPAG